MNAFRTGERIAGQGHPSTLMSMSSLVLALRDRGEYEAAEEVNG